MLEERLEASSQACHAPCRLCLSKRLRISRETGALLERARVTGWFSCAGAERGFSSAQLLPSVALVLAGRDQGGVPRSRQHRRQLRSRRTQSVLRDAVAERR